MVVAAELLLLVVVVVWCVYNLGVRFLLLLSTTGSVLPVQPWSAGLPRLSTKAREHFHSSPSKKRNHVPPRPLPVASPLGLSVTLSGRSPLSGALSGSPTLCAGQLELSNACCCCGGTGRLPPLALGRGTSPPAIRGGQSRTGGNKRDLACQLLFISQVVLSPENLRRKSPRRV